MNSVPSLQEKTIVVVGAGGRIGRKVVRGILGAGGNVVALDVHIDGLETFSSEFGSGSIVCSTVDITDRPSIDLAIASAHARFNGIDGAVNTAYPRNARYGRHFLEVEYEDFGENVARHLGGYFLFMQACCRYSVERSRRFSLVNLSSIYGSIVPRFDVYDGTPMTMPVEYAAIKAGLEHITRYANAYMKGRAGEFRANCVSPGGILAGQDASFLSAYSRHCMSKGMLDADDVIGPILFLLSDGSRYIVGQNIIVDDGFAL